MKKELKGFHSEEARLKAKETKENSLKQVADLQDQETHIVLDYEMKKIQIYTNKATVMNRLERMSHRHIKEDTVDGQIYSRSYQFPISDVVKFLKANIFGVNTKVEEKED